MMLNKNVVLFDLDDTLYKEIDFLCSAYRDISTEIERRFGVHQVYEQMIRDYRNHQDVFQQVIDRIGGGLDKSYLLDRYRSHIPQIRLDQETISCLSALKDRHIPMGLITDGRSITQRNKIHALGLHTWIEDPDIIISEEFGSEKPSEQNYRYFEERYPECCFWYVGDNLQKDFVTPNQLGWQTVCLLDDGRNIHKQDFSLPEAYLPNFRITTLHELLKYLE